MSTSNTDPLRILAVDDETHVLQFYKAVLCFSKSSSDAQSNPFDVVFCNQANEASKTVEKAIEEGKPFAVSFVDLKIGSGPDGLWLAEQIRAMDPHVNIVMVTSHSDLDLREIGRRILAEDKFFYIKKPIHHLELQQMASALTSRWRADMDLKRVHAEMETTIEKRTAQLKKANEQLKDEIRKHQETYQELLQVEKLKSLGEMAGGVAHDFNNILAAILGRVQLIKSSNKLPPDKEEKRKGVVALIKGLDIIEKASLDGAETVRRIQEFSRKRADDSNFTDVNVNELLEHALEFTRAKWKSEAEIKGITVSIQTSFAELPSLFGSAAELREVFTNLITNAIDAMPQGGEIKVKTFKEEKYVCVTLEDTGVGIPDDIQGRIFDPFFTTKGPQSTGLGMSVSYGIISRHRGMITVNSTEGQGATFMIRMPIPEEKSHRKAEKTKVACVPSEGEKARILVVDDEASVCELLYEILTEEGGHEVTTATDGIQALKIFKEKTFDLVLTDLGMPLMSGWQVAEEAKKINDKTPVAMITGWGVQLDEDQLRQNGVDFVLAKPFRMDQVLSLVQESIQLAKMLENDKEVNWNTSA